MVMVVVEGWTPHLGEGETQMTHPQSLVLTQTIALETQTDRDSLTLLCVSVNCIQLLGILFRCLDL